MADRRWPPLAGKALTWDETASLAAMKPGETRRTSMRMSGLNLDIPGTVTRTETGYTFAPDNLADQHETGGPIDWKRPEYGWARGLPLLRKWINERRR